MQATCKRVFLSASSSRSMPLCPLACEGCSVAFLTVARYTGETAELNFPYRKPQAGVGDVFSCGAGGSQPTGRILSFP